MTIVEANGYAFAVMCCSVMEPLSGENSDYKAAHGESIMATKPISVTIRTWELYYLEKNESFLGNCISEEFYKNPKHISAPHRAVGVDR